MHSAADGAWLELSCLAAVRACAKAELVASSAGAVGQFPRLNRHQRRCRGP